MWGSRSSARLVSWLLLSWASACLAPGSALAQPVVVNGFITAQPITVCATDGSGCAPTNNINQTGSNALIGFKEPVTGTDTTNFLATKLLNLRITWLPLVKFNSPIIPSTGTTLQTLHFAPVNPGDCSNLTSSDFPLLVQNFNLTPGSNPPSYTVPNPTNPPGVPINSNAGVPNVFFVNNLMVTGCTGVTLSGHARVGGNGVVINKKIFSLPLLPDVIFHELSHNFGLPHVSDVTNLMAAGGSRTEPTLTVTTPPSPTFLNTAGGNTLDKLTTTLPPDQSGQTNQVVDPIGFTNPILEVQTTITGPTTPNSSTFLVTVTIPATMPDVSVTSVIWEVPPPLGFQPNTFKCNPINCNGLKLTAGNFQGNVGNNDGSILCGPGSFKCFRIDINSTPPNPPFAGGSFSFYLQMSNSNKKTQLTDLTGSNFTYLTSEQYGTTSGVAFSNPSTLFADSHVPNLAISSFINNPSEFVSFTQTPCNPDLLVDPSFGCPNGEIADF